MHHKRAKKKRNVPARFKQYVHICLSTKDSQPYDWNPEKERGFSKEAQISSLFCPLFFSLQITTKRTDKWRNYKNDQVERNTKQEVKASKPVSQPAYIHAYRLFQMHHRIFFFFFFQMDHLIYTDIHSVCALSCVFLLLLLLNSKQKSLVHCRCYTHKNIHIDFFYSVCFSFRNFCILFFVLYERERGNDDEARGKKCCHAYNFIFINNSVEKCMKIIVVAIAYRSLKYSRKCNVTESTIPSTLSTHFVCLCCCFIR